MQYRQLGSSDLKVSEISLGSWLTYGVGVEHRCKAKACVDKAFDLGINLIDTANVYGRGAAESFLGEALKGSGAGLLCARHQAVGATWAIRRQGPVAHAGVQADRRLAGAV